MMWTHKYDLVLKVLKLISLILVLIQIPYSENHVKTMLIVTVIIFFIRYNFLVKTLIFS